jgi:hypothetical protein
MRHFFLRLVFRHKILFILVMLGALISLAAWYDSYKKDNCRAANGLPLDDDLGWRCHLPGER